MKFFGIRRRKKEEIDFDESISDDWVRDAEVFERPVGQALIFYVGLFVGLVGFIVLIRISYLAFGNNFYKARASANLNHTQLIPAPRGVIVDKGGEVLVENRPVFLALLNLGEFFKRQDLQKETLSLVREVLGISEEDLWNKIQENEADFFQEVLVLNKDLDQNQLVKLEAKALPTIQVSRGFTRDYKNPEAFAYIIGYTGVVSKEDLKEFPELGGGDFVGKTGLEAYYEKSLRGIPGALIKVRDAKGNVLEEKGEKEPQIGQELKLTVDAGLEKKFYERLKQGLKDLGRTVGVGLAFDPRDGKVLAMVGVPSFDNNIFNSSTRGEELNLLLSSPSQPLFNRAIAGLYSPGSTIKPLHAVAALEEGVVDPTRKVFSPGYLDIANPYDPEKPTRFLDWRYQGEVNLQSALAQSSNVYFYVIGGGAPSRSMGEAVYEGSKISGLGVNKLHDWWGRFGLGEVLGIDLAGEKKGFLPKAVDREKDGRDWLLGDTYNVSIGQGDLLMTPIQILSYIGAIANGGKVYRPYLAEENSSKVVKDLSFAIDSIEEVQKGMEMAIRAPKGTAYIMNDLPFYVAGKTGSAQVMNKAQENAFFVGYAGMKKEEPEIAILVLIENSKQGSLNAIPIAKDILYWYYLNRMTGKNM